MDEHDDSNLDKTDCVNDSPTLRICMPVLGIDSIMTLSESSPSDATCTYSARAVRLGSFSCAASKSERMSIFDSFSSRWSFTLSQGQVSLMVNMQKDARNGVRKVWAPSVRHMVNQF